MIATLLDRWRGVDNFVARIERLLIVACALVMVAAVFAQSVARFFFDYNLYGAGGWATLLFVWVGFLSASIATRGRKHIVVDIVPRILGERRVAGLLNAIVLLLTALFVGYLFFASLMYLDSPGVQYRRTMVTLPFSDDFIAVKHVVLIMPIALAMVALRSLQVGLEELAIWAGQYPEGRRRLPEGLSELVPTAPEASVANELDEP